MGEVGPQEQVGAHSHVGCPAWFLGDQLHAELVGPGKMTNRQFHDTIIQGGNLPVEMVRARLTQQKLPRDYDANWKYAGDIKKPAQR